jgi:hypothetical protein
VLSIADLQRFDKEKGEALVLCGRQKPFISRLLDIKFYDKDSFEKPTRVIQERKQYEINFKFKPSVNGPIFDWSTSTKDIESMKNKPVISSDNRFNQSAPKSSSNINNRSILESSIDTDEDTESNAIQISSPFDSFLEQLTSGNADKFECSSLPEQPNNTQNLESVNSNLTQLSTTNKDENDT